MKKIYDILRGLPDKKTGFSLHGQKNVVSVTCIISLCSCLHGKEGEKSQ